MAGALEVDGSLRAAKHMMLVAAFALLAWMQGSIWLLLLAPGYTVIDLLCAGIVRRVVGRAEIDRSAIMILLAQHIVCTATFAGIAIGIASLGTYAMQLSAFMLLAAQALHSIASHCESREYGACDVVVIGTALQAVALIGSGWATPAEAIFIHCGLALVTLYFGLAVARTTQTRKRLRRTSDRLLRVQRSGVVGELASGIAHDFNNLLTVMRGNLELLREVPEHERPALLQEIETAAARGGQLVARLSSTARDAPAARAPLAPVLERVERMARSTLPANVKLVVDRRDAPAVVAADPAQLELALLNLAVNARDALPSGGTVLIRAAAVAGGRRVRLTVTDDGEGMTPELLARATEPYETTKPVGKGSGLGLAMVKAFVDEAGGTLRFESARGHGTEVEIVLPVELDVAGSAVAA